MKVAGEKKEGEGIDDGSEEGYERETSGDKARMPSAQHLFSENKKENKKIRAHIEK